ncbi:MAG: 4Fe-4S binding protein [Phocaeicola sp.]
MRLAVDTNRCPQNHTCPMIAQCPAGAIMQEGVGVPVIDNEKCVKCGKCIKICGKRAVYKIESNEEIV